MNKLYYRAINITAGRNLTEMRKELIDSMVETGLRGESISNDQALQLESFTHEELDYLFIGTDRIRDRFKGDDVKICSIVKETR